MNVLYFYIKSKVLVNGFFTEPFNVSSSVRQGCSLSPLLYVLCIEPFASVIRNDIHIKGFRLPGSSFECRISQYADDCTFTVWDTRSILKILNIYEIFGMASGSKLNKEKSLAVLIGDWDWREGDLYGIKWSHDNIKICGIKIGNSDFVSYLGYGVGEG